jgi:hypothetical protein
MGMGQALSEQTQHHEGLPLRANLLDYRIRPSPNRRRSTSRWSRAWTRWGPSAPRRPAKAACTGAAGDAAAIHDALGLRLAETRHARPVLDALLARRRERQLAAAARARPRRTRRRRPCIPSTED